MICKRIKERPWEEVCDKCIHGKSHTGFYECYDSDNGCECVCEEEFIELVKKSIKETQT